MLFYAAADEGMATSPQDRENRAALLQQAQALAEAQLAAQRKLVEEQQAAEQALLKQRRLRLFMRGATEGETTVTFPPLSEAGAATSCCDDTYGLLADRSTCLAAVVCHAWGPLGGSTYEPTVSEIVSVLSLAGLTTLRFKFRSGVGRGHSAGDDVRGACAFLRSLDAPPRRILLVGYSYGACVVADVADSIKHVAAFALVSPPLGAASALFLCRDVTREAVASGKPKLAVMGEHDQFCSPQRFAAFAESLSPPRTYHLLRDERGGACCASGCGHHRHQPRVHHFNVFERLEAVLVPWLAETFGVPFAQLAGCSGQVRALPVVQGVAMAEPHEDDEEEEDDERMDRETRTTEPLLDASRSLTSIYRSA